MKLRTQILALGVVGLIMTALVGGAGLLNANQLSQAFDNSINMGLALQKSQNADSARQANQLALNASTLAVQGGEVVSSIRRVTDTMGEISAAINEQSEGVQEVDVATSQMDQATQQNAALVEEMAAAASSLQGQADDLIQSVAVFRLADEQTYGRVLNVPRLGG